MFTVERNDAMASQAKKAQSLEPCATPPSLRIWRFREDSVVALVAQGSTHLCHPTAVGSCNDSQSSCNRWQTEKDRPAQYPRFGRPGPDEDQPGQVASKVTWTGLQRLIFPHWTLVFDAQKRLKDGMASDR